jgi:hypothetical protein
MAGQTASVSYKAVLDEYQLARALATGHLLAELVAHMSTLIDEVTLPIIVSAVQEAARVRGVRGVPPKCIDNSGPRP